MLANQFFGNSQTNLSTGSAPGETAAESMSIKLSLFRRIHTRSLEKFHPGTAIAPDSPRIEEHENVEEPIDQAVINTILTSTDVSTLRRWEQSGVYCNTCEVIEYPGATLVTCCQCGNGPFVGEISPKCVECDHIVGPI
jgi:hypothetical protein